MKLAKKYLYSTILGLSLGVGMSTNVVKAAPSSNSAVVSPTSDPSQDEQANPDLSGKVEDVSYTVKDDQLTLYGGTIKKFTRTFHFLGNRMGSVTALKSLRLMARLNLSRMVPMNFLRRWGILKVYPA